ncbi:hypothetical protein [Quadrisphaera setariae]|uniref:Uncharacterized protein n=1 Tax=Quadrisphaera setariae TaxID=2593304 RepID=A0A5C8ZIP6_9ACTN|nr:hypothetical protein [Quadrisphaera setariae]TXR57464.1 hypothetical protein FMM08_04265 [Quadrisphaera setariae]
MLATWLVTGLVDYLVRVANTPRLLLGWILGTLLAVVSPAALAAKLIVDSDAWTDREQEEVKQLLRRAVALLEEERAERQRASAGGALGGAAGDVEHPLGPRGGGAGTGRP